MAMVLGVSCVAVTGSLTWQLSVVEAVASMVLVTNISFYFFLNLCDTYMLLFRISGVWEEMWLMCQYSGSIPVLGIFLAKGIRACSSGGRALDF